MGFYDRLMNLDRRWVYLFVAIAVILPILLQDFGVPIIIPPYITPEAKNVYNFVEKLKADDILFLAIDYDPPAMAELHPVARAILKQCFKKNVKVIISALSQNGPGMAEQLISQTAREYNKVNGVDYVYLGYKPFPAIVIMGMSQNFKLFFPKDYYNTPLDSLPMMRKIRSIKDTKGVISVCAGNIADWWINEGAGRYNYPLALAVTGVMAADYYPFLNSGQIFGLVSGMKGAAEYEYLMEKGGYMKKEEFIAGRSMPIQTFAHAVVILFIIIGNIGYFMSKRKKL
jgi:hypothetical protein